MKFVVSIPNNIRMEKVCSKFEDAFFCELLRW